MITYEDFKDSPILSDEKAPRRKSMLSCGRRRSKSLGGPGAAAEFCRSIPVTLPKEERLKHLLKMSFQHALLTVCREFSENTDFDMTHVIDTLSEHYDVIESLFEKDNLISLTVSDQSEAKQSEDIAIEKYVEGLAVLEKESEEWDIILKEEEAKLSKCLSSNSEIFPPSSDDNDLTEAESYNYNELLKNTNTMLNQFTLLADHISNNNSVPRAVLHSSNKHLKNASVLASRYLAKDLQDTPRTLLKDLKVVH